MYAYTTFVIDNGWKNKTFLCYYIFSLFYYPGLELHVFNTCCLEFYKRVSKCFILIILRNQIIAMFEVTKGKNRNEYRRNAELSQGTCIGREYWHYSNVESKITWKHIPAGQARIMYSCVERRTIVKCNMSHRRTCVSLRKHVGTSHHHELAVVKS